MYMPIFPQAHIVLSAGSICPRSISELSAQAIRGRRRCNMPTVVKSAVRVPRRRITDWRVLRRLGATTPECLEVWLCMHAYEWHDRTAYSDTRARATTSGDARRSRTRNTYSTRVTWSSCA